MILSGNSLSVVLAVILCLKQFVKVYERPCESVGINIMKNTTTPKVTRPENIASAVKALALFIDFFFVDVR